MAGWLEDIFDKGEYGFPKAFIKACPAGSATQQMKARTEELRATWEPTGFYSWQQMADLVAAAVELSSKASSMALQAFQQNPNDILRKASDDYMNVAKRAREDYAPAWQAAKAANAPINAPGFKRWVIELLEEAHKLARISEISVCTAPWWYGALTTFMYYFDKVVDLAKTIGGIVVAVGQTVVDAVESAFNLWPIVKWGGLALGVIFGGVYLWNKLEFTAENARKPIDWEGAFSRWKRRARGLVPGGGVRSLFRRRKELPSGNMSGRR